MTDLAFAFAPLLPWPVLAGFAVIGAAALVLAAARGQRGAAPRALALALILAALADPSLVREKRDPQKTVVAVVLDKSESQNFGARTAQTEEARKALDAAIAKFGDVETRVITAAHDAGGNDGTARSGRGGKTFRPSASAPPYSLRTASFTTSRRRPRRLVSRRRSMR